MFDLFVIIDDLQEIMAMTYALDETFVMFEVLLQEKLIIIDDMLQSSDNLSLSITDKGAIEQQVLGKIAVDSTDMLTFTNLWELHIRHQPFMSDSSYEHDLDKFATDTDEAKVNNSCTTEASGLPGAKTKETKVITGFITISHEAMFVEGAKTVKTCNSEDDTVSRSLVSGARTTVLTFGKGIAGTEALNKKLQTALT